MTAVQINAYKIRPKFTDLTDDEAKTLIRVIKMSSEQNGILVMKSLAASIKRALVNRRKYCKFNKVNYKWDWK